MNEIQTKLDVEIDAMAFKGPKVPDRGFTVQAFYLKRPSGDALVQVMRNDTMIREFLFPAYKIWNIQAHFKDIVDSEIANDVKGYEAAAWNGISGAVFIVPKLENGIKEAQ